MWFLQIIRSFFFTLDSALFNFIPFMYDVLIKISRTSILSQGEIQEFAGRIQSFLGVFMLFKVSFSLVTYLVNPDEFSDKSKGFGKLWQNAIISLIMLVLVPYAFNMAYDLQAMILEDNTLATLIFGNQNVENNYLDTAGDKMAYTIMIPFFSPNLSATFTDSDGVTKDLSSCVVLTEEVSDQNNNVRNVFNEDCKNDLLSAVGAETDVDIENYTHGVENQNLGLTFRLNLAKRALEQDKDTFLIDYRVPLTTVIAVVVGLLLITFSMDVALRSLKLSFLQLIAPIPIISFIDPKSGKDGLFKKWYQMCFSTYISLFVRLLALYLGIYIISLISGMQDVVNGSLVTDPLVQIFIIIGVLMFAKQLPKILEGLGIKIDGAGGKFTLNPFKKFEDEALGGKQILGAGAAVGAAGLAGAVNFGSRVPQMFNKDNWTNRKTGKVTFGSFMGGLTRPGLSAIGGASSALFRGAKKTMKGEKAGKVFSDSYGEAMFAKLQREDLTRKGSTFVGRRASDIARLTGNLNEAQKQTLGYGNIEEKYKADTNNIKMQQDALKRQKDSEKKAFVDQDKALSRMNEKISNAKFTQNFADGTKREISVKDAQERVDDLKRTNSYYVKAGDEKRDENGNLVYKDVFTDIKDRKTGRVIGQAKQRVVDRYTVDDEANREISYLGKQADANLKEQRDIAFNHLINNDYEMNTLSNTIKESNSEILKNGESYTSHLVKEEHESDAHFETRKKEYIDSLIVGNFDGTTGKMTNFDKGDMYKVKDRISDVDAKYITIESNLDDKMRELQDKFEADVAKFEKDGPKWNANVADHAATSVKGPQPDNWMPSPDTSHSGFTYDNRFIGGFGGNGQNGNGTPPPPGGPHHTR